MKKIPTIFVRDPETNLRYVTRIPHPDCGWVFAGEGQATRKYDGTCMMLDEHGRWWARREVKPGKTPPPDFVAVETDEVTAKTVGWEPVGQSAFVRYHAQALDARGVPQPSWHVGTYELCGPKVNGNPEGFGVHCLIRHDDAEVMPDVRDFDSIAEVLAGRVVEGIVWHHPDGRMAKIKRKDFP
jgi:Family of unknown function (DUF5565)